MIKVKEIMSRIVSDESSELYDADWTGKKCPYVEIGDEITVKDWDHLGEPIISKVRILEFDYSPTKIGVCRVYDKLKIARCDNGNWYNVTNSPETDCKTCKIKLGVKNRKGAVYPFGKESCE